MSYNKLKQNQIQRKNISLVFDKCYSHLWFNLYIIQATLHCYWFICKHTFKMIKKFFSLARSKIWICILVAPNKCGLFIFNCGSIGCFGIKLHHRLGNLFPTGVCYRSAGFPFCIPPKSETRQPAVSYNLTEASNHAKVVIRLSA